MKKTPAYMISVFLLSFHTFREKQVMVNMSFTVKSGLKTEELLRNMVFGGEEGTDKKIVRLAVENSLKPDLVVSYSLNGLVTGRKVSKEFDVPLVLNASEKIFVPDSKTRALGAVASDGTLWIDDAVREEHGISDGFIEKTKTVKAKRLGEHSKTYRGEFPGFKDRRVLLVGDSSSQGYRAAATAGSIFKKSPESISLATQYMSQDRGVVLVDMIDRVLQKR
jgi:predicted phosphoribosyltransferase